MLITDGGHFVQEQGEAITVGALRLLA